MAPGASIRAFDPAVMEAARAMLPEVEMADTAARATKGANLAIILTEWPAFRQMVLTRLARSLKAPLLVDLRNLLAPEHEAGAGLTYVSIGRPTLALG